MKGFGPIPAAHRATLQSASDAGARIRDPMTTSLRRRFDSGSY